MDAIYENIKNFDIGAKKIKNQEPVDIQYYINLCDTTIVMLDSIKYSKTELGDLHEIVQNYKYYFVQKI